METQPIPSMQVMDAKGETYARIAPTFFPGAANGESRLVHRITSSHRAALWDRVKAWYDGGTEASGAIHPDGAYVHPFTGKGGATWRIYADGVPKEARVAVAWSSFATPMATDPHTFGDRWASPAVQPIASPPGALIKLPEYFRLVTTGGKPQWVPVRAEEVPPETGLTAARFERPAARRPKTYATPDEADSPWKKPGPVAGLFQALPGDGSVITDHGYRFADQPALLKADLTDPEREALQVRVEKIHRSWKKDRAYLANPAGGKLADLDPALLVTPPRRLEAGFVPIVARQAPQH